MRLNNFSTQAKFAAQTREEAYAWIQKQLIELKYDSLTKSDKGVVKQYFKKATGYSRAQITRLIAEQKSTGYIKVVKGCKNKFEKKYEYADIRLLAQTDELHDYPNGAALKRILSRMWKVYKDEAYRNIAKISVAYIYVIRQSLSYKKNTKRYQKTKPNVVSIGSREKPGPNGKPGYIRVDTVHQGDKDGEKGVYHINTIDEISQFEIIGAAEKISEAYLLPLLAKLIEAYPFRRRTIINSVNYAGF